MALPAVIEPCLPSPGERLPTGLGWVHEIKHDGYRLMARRDALSVGIRLLTGTGMTGPPATRSIVEGFDDTLPGTGEQHGTGAMLHWILFRLAAYVAVLVAFGLLFLAGASMYALMWPRPVVPFGQMGH